MMESLRRRLSRQTGRDSWATDLSLEPETSEVSELHLDDAAILSTAKVQSRPGSNDVDLKDYYRGLIYAAIQHGGEYQGQQISVPWLRMTLAGLEMRPMPPEMMWEGEQDLAADMPGYEELFPSGSIVP
jgi:hypothetical protein